MDGDFLTVFYALIALPVAATAFVWFVMMLHAARFLAAWRRRLRVARSALEAELRDVEAEIKRVEASIRKGATNA